MALLSSPWQAIKSTPPATRAFTCLLVALSFAHWWLQFSSSPDAAVPSTPLLTLVPGNALYSPWSIVTAGFVETHFLELLLTLLILPACLRYLERLWGALETLKFVTITLTVSNFIALALNWLEWALTDKPYFLYGMDYHGQTALQTGVLVAFTQLIPEHQVQFFGAFSIRVKRLPMLYVGVSNVLCILGYQSPWILIQFGWLVSWTYLRFYKRTTDSLSGVVTYGDRSETFAFVQWFPPFVHKPLSAISTATHNLAIKLKLIRPFSHSDDHHLESGGYAPLPSTGAGVGRAEAERRRALALKALDQRLASSGGRATPATPGNARASTSTNAQTTAGSSTTATAAAAAPPPANSGTSAAGASVTPAPVHASSSSSPMPPSSVSPQQSQQPARPHSQQGTSTDAAAAPKPSKEGTS